MLVDAEEHEHPDRGQDGAAVADEDHRRPVHLDGGAQDNEVGGQVLPGRDGTGHDGHAEVLQDRDDVDWLFGGEGMVLDGADVDRPVLAPPHRGKGQRLAGKDALDGVGRDRALEAVAADEASSSGHRTGHSAFSSTMARRMAGGSRRRSGSAGQARGKSCASPARRTGPPSGAGSVWGRRSRGRGRRSATRRGRSGVRARRLPGRATAPGGGPDSTRRSAAGSRAAWCTPAQNGDHGAPLGRAAPRWTGCPPSARRCQYPSGAIGHGSDHYVSWMLRRNVVRAAVRRPTRPPVGPEQRQRALKNFDRKRRR